MLLQMLEQIRFSELCLRAVGQRLQRPQTFGHFVVAGNERVLRAEFVRLAEGFAKFLLHRRQLHAESCLAQIFRCADGGRLRALAHPRDVYVAALLNRRLPAFLQRQDQAVFANGKADTLGWRTAQQFYQPIVASAAADGILRTESLRRDFKRGAHVIVEAAHKSPVLAVDYSAHFELMFYGSVVLRAVLAQVIGDARQLGDDGLLAFEFGIEDTQRVRFNAPLAVRPELVLHFQERGAQQFDIFGAAFAAADRIDIELDALQFQAVEKRHDHFDHFGVDRWSVTAAQHFRANLIKLPVAPLLRALAPEHRPYVIQLHRLRQLLHSMLDVSPAHGCSCFWAETYELYLLFDGRLECLLEILHIDAEASLQCILHQSINHVSRVSERKHLFGDDVSVAADGTCEELG